MNPKIYSPKGYNSTPFNPMMKHFDYVCGQVIKENQLLKFVVIISCIGFLLSVAICLYAVGQPDSIPVLVTMNDFGETQYIGEVSRKNYQNFNVPEVAIAYQVRNFISLKETLSIDRKIMQDNRNEIYSILTGSTSQKFNTLVKEEQLYDGFGEKTREVVFQSEPLQLSSDTYQVDYKKITRSLSGSISEQEVLRAIVSIKLLKPNKDDITRNPLGIYITNFDIKKISNSMEIKE